MLRKTLTSHVDAKLRIEADIPAEAITAGACELNAFALRTELGDKHMAIINKILATHSEHILEFSDFLDSRYKSMMRELCKQPEDIEGADSAFSVTLNLTRSPRWRPRDATSRRWRHHESLRVSWLSRGNVATVSVPRRHRGPRGVHCKHEQ